jgi:hypothetical protein
VYKVVMIVWAKKEGRKYSRTHSNKKSLESQTISEKGFSKRLDDYGVKLRMNFIGKLTFGWG